MSELIDYITNFVCFYLDLFTPKMRCIVIITVELLKNVAIILGICVAWLQYCRMRGMDKKQLTQKLMEFSLNKIIQSAHNELYPLYSEIERRMNEKKTEEDIGQYLKSELERDNKKLEKALNTILEFYINVAHLSNEKMCDKPMVENLFKSNMAHKITGDW